MVLKWRLFDPSDVDPETNNYVFEWSPNKMSSPFPKRNITTTGTTAVDGQALLWEGSTQPTAWTFGGAIPNREQYETLRSWVYDRKGRLYLWDHFGRRFTVLLREFTADPPERHKRGRYWFHTYTIEALVLAVSAPTVGNEGPL